MLNPSNGLSLLRAPLAFAFLVDSPLVRTIVVLLAMITDCFDGYLARKFKYTTRVGAILDPLMDKFFVYFTLCVLFFESKISVWQGAAMLSRDVFLCLFGIYLILSKNWESYKFRSIKWGKITTATQFFVLITISLGYTLPQLFYVVFVIFGMLAFIELLQLTRETIAKN